MSGDVESAMHDVFGKKKSHKKIIGVIILFGISAVILALFYPNALPVSLPGINGIGAEDVAFVSQADTYFQSDVKNITGYDWDNFVGASGNENAKTAALLFLANEIDAMDDSFNFVNRSAGLSKSAFPARMNASDTSKSNALRLIANAKVANNAFASKGMDSAKIRANRLSAIESFFGRHELPEGAIAQDAKIMFAEALGFSVDDYSRLVSLMTINYNLFAA